MNPRKIIVVFSIFLISTFLSSLYSQIDCSRFYTGKYFFKDNLGKISSKIVRRKNVQIEKGTDPTSGKVIRSKERIVWIDECTYELISIKNNLNEDDIMDSTLTYRIIMIADNYCIVKLLNSVDDITFKMYSK